MATELKEYEGQLNSFLAEAFRKHGVGCEIENDLLIFKKERITACAKVFDMTSSSATVLQLDVNIEIGVGKGILESCVGMGMSMDAAMADAWKSFLNNSFHVLLTAFFIPEDSELISRYQWPVGGRTYEVIMSRTAFRGELPEPLPLKWYGEFENMIKKQELPEGNHWIRLFYAQSAREMMTCEILLDNEIWHSVESEARSFDFPRSNDFLSLRIFMVMKDGYDISQAAATIACMTDEDDKTIEEQLVESGMSIEDAEKAEVFIPLAFGRVFLRSMTTIEFPDEAVVTNDTGEEVNINLSNEAIYTTAYRLAEQIMVKGCMNKKHFETILLQSSELNAYNKALHDGVTPEDMEGSRFGSPMIFLPNYKIREKEADVPTEEEKEKKKTSWKKFWKK